MPCAFFIIVIINIINIQVPFTFCVARFLTIYCGEAT